jgi:hypothetical protein
MSTIKHTPEPWVFDGEFIESEQMVICQLFNKHEDDFPNKQANAARIVACVNACAGMENPEADIKRYKKALSSCLYYLQKIANMPEYRQDEIKYLAGRGVLELEHALPDIFPDL